MDSHSLQRIIHRHGSEWESSHFPWKESLDTIPGRWAPLKSQRPEAALSMQPVLHRDLRDVGSQCPSLSSGAQLGLQSCVCSAHWCQRGSDHPSYPCFSLPGKKSCLGRPYFFSSLASRMRRLGTEDGLLSLNTGWSLKAEISQTMSINHGRTESGGHEQKGRKGWGDRSGLRRKGV